MKHTHTQGPWIASGSGIYRNDGISELIAVVQHKETNEKSKDSDNYAPSQKMADANAKLIACAPKLLEALQNIIAELSKEGWALELKDKVCVDAQEAIAKATGEA